ncbi:putative short-chain dehydrogenase [Thozetella sp. PMI_491]|nr:putative short-chain dehydrogenase [Thozetella sp. PMI_491]
MSARSAAKGVSDVIGGRFITLPIPQGDFSGRTVIVTGSNQGLGFEASKHLVRLGVERLIMGVRTISKGEAAREELLKSAGTKTPPIIEVWQIDMEDYESVKSFAARAAGLPRLDALLANAGLASSTFTKVAGHERNLTVNVVSTFLLCLLLVPKMRESAAATGVTPRVSIPNSALHYTAPIKELDPSTEIFATLDNPDKANMGARYPLSKLLVIYIIRELVKRLEQTKAPTVIFNTPNPSYCKSQLMRETPASLGVRVFEKLLARETEEGSRTLVDGLSKGEESNGQYLNNCHVQE